MRVYELKLYSSLTGTKVRKGCFFFLQDEYNRHHVLRTWRKWVVYFQENVTFVKDNLYEIVMSKLCKKKVGSPWQNINCWPYSINPLFPMAFRLSHKGGATLGLQSIDSIHSICPSCISTHSAWVYNSTWFLRCEV